MTIDVGIIGGTGIGERLAALGGKPVHVPTSAGMLRGRLLDYDGVELLLIRRHSAGHKVPPHRVNYAAMALGLKQLGAKACLSTAAVGSVRPEWGPGTLVNCSDFVDLTARNPTLFDRTVAHTDFTEPFSAMAREAIQSASAQVGIPVEPSGIYICGNGPRYETPHEIQLFRHLGDLVGMTASSEAILMREAGVPYACLAVATNLAAGISANPLSHEEVVEEMRRSGESAVKIILAAAKEIAGQ